MRNTCLSTRIISHKIKLKRFLENRIRKIRGGGRMTLTEQRNDKWVSIMK